LASCLLTKPWRDLVAAGRDQDGASHHRQPARGRRLDGEVAEGEKGEQRNEPDQQPDGEVAGDERNGRHRALAAIADHHPMREHDRADRRQHHRRHHPEPHHHERRPGHVVGHACAHLAKTRSHPGHDAGLADGDVPAEETEPDQRYRDRRGRPPVQQAPGGAGWLVVRSHRHRPT